MFRLLTSVDCTEVASCAKILYLVDELPQITQGKHAVFSGAVRIGMLEYIGMTPSLPYGLTNWLLNLVTGMLAVKIDGILARVCAPVLVCGGGGLLFGKG
jgi:hypothetical protein